MNDERNEKAERMITSRVDSSLPFIVHRSAFTVHNSSFILCRYDS